MLPEGVYHWTATHPEWTEEEGGQDGWEPEVSSYALVEEDTVVLIDPLVPADDEESFDTFEPIDCSEVEITTPLEGLDCNFT